MPAHLKSFMRNSDCVQKKKNIVPFLAFEKRVVTPSTPPIQHKLHLNNNYPNGSP
jgi:hypothetical protein